jgi:hypothetical protein
MPRPDEVDFRGWRFETFEERLAFSAEPIADFWIDPASEPIVEPSSAFVEPLATAEVPAASDVAAARQQFGLPRRQTDGGDHRQRDRLRPHRARRRIGQLHRVVGGWDFAERDADPYDDGPAGFHGTHVAGIVGASDRRYPGLAPDVDLVALRVFDDQGGGYFAWVEQALAWVHEHRFAFENPITTVNLSLGTEWNANSLPTWATLEDELKQLASDGILSAVAAGNSFQTMNVAGLSYPAVSSYVLPVASVDAQGNLSRFSQARQPCAGRRVRRSRALCPTPSMAATATRTIGAVVWHHGVALRRRSERPRTRSDDEPSVLGKSIIPRSPTCFAARPIRFTTRSPTRATSGSMSKGR